AALRKLSAFATAAAGRIPRWRQCATVSAPESDYWHRDRIGESTWENSARDREHIERRRKVSQTDGASTTEPKRLHRQTTISESPLFPASRCMNTACSLISTPPA